MSTNWWKYASQYMQYGALAVWSVAFTTQFLSLLGNLTDINLLIWTYGVFGLGMLVYFSIGTLYFLAYDTAYSNLEAGASAEKTAVKEIVW